MNTSATYKDLVEYLEKNPDRLDDNISVRILDEYYECSIKIADSFDGVLDEDHIFLEIC